MLLGFNPGIKQETSSVWLFNFKVRDCVSMKKHIKTNKQKKHRPIPNFSPVWSRKPEASKLPESCRKMPCSEPQ